MYTEIFVGLKWSEVCTSAYIHVHIYEHHIMTISVAGKKYIVV